jgi:hypothetical protein
MTTPSLPFAATAPMHDCPMCSGSGKIDDDHHRRMIEDRPGVASHRSPATSKKAASRTIGFGTERYIALNTLDRHGPNNASEVTEHGRMKSKNQTATRLGELRTIGYVEYVRDSAGDKVEAPTSTGDTGFVQRITSAGRSALLDAARKAK